jgi:hypothetical protein
MKTNKYELYLNGEEIGSIYAIADSIKYAISSEDIEIMQENGYDGLQHIPIYTDREDIPFDNLKG